jgi:tRNA(Ile)-lysidine synthase
MAETNSNGEIQVPISSFTELPDGLRSRGIRHVIKMIRDLRRVTMRHIEAVNRLATGKNPHAQVNLPHGLIVKRVYDRLVFTVRKDKKSEGFCYSLDGPGTFHLDALESTISLEEMEKRAIEDMDISPWTVFLNADHLTYPLMIRNFLPGDRFVPLGMSGHKKLKDFFIDLKIPLKARGRIPILTCRNLPIWVCGLRIDDRFRITPDTRTILKVSLDNFTLTLHK